MKSIQHWHTCHFNQILLQLLYSLLTFLADVKLQNAKPWGTQSRLCKVTSQAIYLIFSVARILSNVMNVVALPYSMMDLQIDWWGHKKEKPTVPKFGVWSQPQWASMHQCTHLLGLAIDNWGWFESLALWTTWSMRLSTHLILSRTKNALKLRLNKQNSSFGIMLALPTLRWHSNHVILW
jgi:hypothetical protein